MNLEDLLTKLQVERKVWQDRASEQIDKAYQSDLADKHHFNLQSSYDQGVAWGLYLSSTLILQEQLETKQPKEEQCPIHTDPYPINSPKAAGH